MVLIEIAYMTFYHTRRKFILPFPLRFLFTRWTIQGTNHSALTLNDVTNMYAELDFGITHSDVIEDLEN